MDQIPANSVRTSLTLAGLGLIGQPGPVLCEGWMLKKRRKKMQGFARRYFTLYESGVLEYAFEPQKPARDHILMQSAAISSSPGHKDIHLDASNATFHVKCLTMVDFQMWMTALRTFVVTTVPEGNRPIVRRKSIAGTAPRLANQLNTTLSEMGLTITELENTAQHLQAEESKKKGKDHHSSSRMHLFKRHHGPEGTHTSEASESATTPTKLQSLIDALKEQHETLVQSMRQISLVDNSSPTLPTMREEPHSPVSPVASTRASRRTSTASGLSVWFDAEEPDGATEFIMENDTAPSTSNSRLLDDLQEEVDNDSGDDTDEESERNGEHTPTTVTRDSSSVRSKNTSMTSAPKQQHREVVRRTQLPSGPVGDEGSLFSVLKKNIGKDLSQVVMPVTFNEPLTLLERAAEELEYFDLLDQAAQAPDEAERLCYIAAFAVSGYACTKNRSGRKSFNPMLGETFEDSRTHFIAEKVVHNPLVMAYHADGKGWELNGTSSGKTKFWGKSLEIIPTGKTRLRIGNDVYEWKKPSSFMRNLMMGTKYLEHTGEMVISNTMTGARCSLEFLEAGYWSPPNVVKGTVYTSSGQATTTLEGKWDEQLARKLNDSHLHVLWRIAPFPKNSRELYGFTSFGITLHECTPDLEGKLPPTDSRLRPDVTALERGDLDTAESEKLRVEEAQRERRRAGKDVQPRWFKKVGEEDWEYTGGYWEQREQGWHDIQPLW